MVTWGLSGTSRKKAIREHEYDIIIETISQRRETNTGGMWWISLLHGHLDRSRRQFLEHGRADERHRNNEEQGRMTGNANGSLARGQGSSTRSPQIQEQWYSRTILSWYPPKVDLSRRGSLQRRIIDGHVFASLFPIQWRGCSEVVWCNVGNKCVNVDQKLWPNDIDGVLEKTCQLRQPTVIGAI